MPRAERFTATEPLAVERAQLVDPAAFKFSTAGAEAMAQIGGILVELGKRKLEMQDRIGISNINAAMENGVLEYQKEIIGKPLEEHAGILQKHINNTLAFASKERLSADTRKLADNKLKIWSDFVTDTAEIANLRAIERDALIRLTADYEKAFTEAEGDDNNQDVIDAKQALIEQLAISYSPAEAVVMFEKAEQRAAKQMIENARHAQMNLAAVNPEQVKTTIDTELKSRRKGKKPSQEFALLSNTDLEAIRDYANSVGEKMQTDSKIAMNAVVKESYKKIVNGDIDIVSMANAILTDPIMSDGDKSVAVEKIKTFFSTWNSAIDAKIVTSNSTRIKALKIVSSVHTADITENEGLAQYEKLSKAEKINGIDGKTFINGIFAAAKSAEDFPLNTNRAKIYFGLLETLYEDGAIEPLEFDKMHTALVDFFDRKPDATAKEASEFYEELIEPATTNILERIWNWSGKSPWGTRYWLKKVRGKPEVKVPEVRVGEANLSDMTDEELEAIIRGK